MDERALPVTPAAAQSVQAVDAGARRELAEQIALDLEGRRRSWTLGGGLLLIPASAGVAVAASAAIWVPVAWLPLCAILGSAIGPALTTACIAASSVFGTPALRRAHRRRCRALGLSEDEIEDGWARAARILDDKARKMLGNRSKDDRRERAEARAGQG